MKQRMKKVLSVAMAMCMLMGLLSTVAFASEAEPIIIAQPEDFEIVNGEDATYTVVAEGEELTYQWYYIAAGMEPMADPEFDDMLVDCEFYSGVDTATLTVYSTWALDEDPDCNYNGDMFYCVVSNENGDAISDVVEYIVTDHPPLEGDATEHWYPCFCDEVMDFYEEHVDEDADGTCDICNIYFEHPFVDVTDPEAWYYDAATYVYWEGYFKGDTEGKFNADHSITRAEVATALSRVLGMNVIEDLLGEMSDEEFEQFLETIADAYGLESVVAFSDIEGEWYERTVLYLANMGFISGYEDGTFRGDNNITRQEIAVLMSRIAKYAEEIIGDQLIFGEAAENYNDAADVADWAAEYVEWSRASGLIIGDENGNFNPDANATRAEFAQLLVRYDEATFAGMI
ncbi:MAG: S-layer homology domain-containing protein [Clostridia bacterium]|nr:S-layer homology domain-containing protein [Clostridia bacterium]